MWSTEGARIHPSLDSFIGRTLAIIGMLLIAVGGTLAVSGREGGLQVGVIGLIVVVLGASFQKRAIIGT